MIDNFDNFKINGVSPGWLEAKLTEKHVDFLWKCIDERKKEVYKNLAGNLFGSYSLSNKNNNQIFFNKIIDPLLFDWMNTYGSSIFQDQLQFGKGKSEMIPFLNDWWVNFQHEGDYNPIHNHGGLFSFVIWMKIPTDYKKQMLLPRCVNSNSSTVSNFQFIYTDHIGKIVTHTYYMSPDMEGTMLFFPARLNHTVYPFYDCKEERISISGNISLSLK